MDFVQIWLTKKWRGYLIDKDLAQTEIIVIKN